MRKVIILTLFLIMSLFSISLQAETIHIYLNGEDHTATLNPIVEKGNVLVNAQSLARLLNADLNWQQSIRTLTISRNDIEIKMMVDSSFIQINNRTSRSSGSMRMINGSNYLPLREIAENFGFLFERNTENIYITRPESYIKNIAWRENGQQIIIEMDNIPPYRINQTDDPNRLEIELDRVALSDSFRDNLSNNNYYLRVHRISNQARIRLVIIGNQPIPFINDHNIEEDDNNLLLNFLPSISEISWRNSELEIISNGEISRPDIMLLQDPRRLVLDIPDLMLQNYEMSMPENDWIKDVRVSQFKYDPVVLRVVLDLYEDRFLHLKESQENNKIVLETTSDRTVLDNLLFENDRLEFVSDNPIVPDIFHLEDPDRLVINIMNAVRGDSFKDDLELDSNIVSRLRTSRFNEETVRIVADMYEMTGYRMTEERLSDGSVKHIINFENNFEDILISDTGNRTNVNLKFSGSVDYEVKRFTHPDRFVIDVEGVNLRDGYELPESLGVIKDVRLSQYSSDPEITRFVFLTDDYEDYNVFSMDSNTSINISFVKEVSEDVREEIIVLDPGHGGFDPGAIGRSGLTEKEVALDISLLTERLLRNAGYEVVMTRDKDEFVSLQDRVEMANDLNAMVFVSIHANSSNYSFSEGIETYFAPNKKADSFVLANILQNELVKELNRLDRGVKTANFYVIRHTNMPSALVEVGFLSNPHEESLLASSLFKEKAARAISRAILEFIENN